MLRNLRTRHVPSRARTHIVYCFVVAFAWLASASSAPAPLPSALGTETAPVPSSAWSTPSAELALVYGITADSPFANPQELQRRIQLNQAKHEDALAWEALARRVRFAPGDQLLWCLWGWWLVLVAVALWL